MNLASLSLYRCRHGMRVPSPPTNTERLRAFRQFQPVQFANTAFPRPADTANSPPIPADGSGGDSFDTPGYAWHPMTETEGRQYEAEEMQSGRANEYDDRGFLIE